MSFIADKQTLDDLNLLGKFKQHSIFNLFNKVKTAGGERLLDELFRHPFTDPIAINERSNTFRYFQQQQMRFSFKAEAFRNAENYLLSDAAGNVVSAAAATLRKKMMASFLRDEQYTIMYTGLLHAIEMLCTAKELFSKMDIAFAKPARDILADSRLSWLCEVRNEQPLVVAKVAKYDFLLRHSMRDQMQQLLNIIYRVDVYIAVSDVARERGFTYAMALPSSANTFRATAIRHPAMDKAVANPLSLDHSSNVLFLTGANMAGKSTFMKSFGIAVYLAHMGFPVAAGDMEFSVRDGLYSSINVPDSLSLGYSHFYAEVLRVKKVAEEVASGENMVVIFDELFKGTNVKDAYDATLSVTAAFARYSNCLFIISTHIIEVGEALRPAHDNLRFAYLPTVMNGPVPTYPYILTDGITNDRHGMIIIENEKIIDIIKS